MSWCVVLYCVVLYCIVLCWIVLYCIVLFGLVQFVSGLICSGLVWFWSQLVNSSFLFSCLTLSIRCIIALIWKKNMHCIIIVLCLALGCQSAVVDKREGSVWQHRPSLRSKTWMCEGDSIYVLLTFARFHTTSWVTAMQSCHQNEPITVSFFDLQTNHK